MSLSNQASFVLSSHARARAQQRGVTLQALELTLQFGKQSWGNDGLRISCTKASQSRMKKQGVKPHEIERAAKTVLVVKEDCVVTVVPKGSDVRHKR